MEKKTLTQNGITVYDYGNKYLHSFCICIYVKAGILYENEQSTGITHLWEHMTFKNINAILNGEMARTLDRMGAYFNASTYKELVEFKIAAAGKYFDKCAKIITSVFDELILNEQEFETEKKRIKSEIREEDEKSTIDYYANKKVWKGTPVARTISGNIKDVTNISFDNLKAYHDEVRVSDNIFVYVTGKYTDKNLEKLCSYIEKKKFKTGKICDNVVPVPEKMFNRNGAIYTKKSDVNEVRFSFDVDRSKCSQVELDLLYDIMFNGESCKVFDVLSDKTGLIYSYDSAMELYENVGNMYFSYMVKGKKLIPSIKMVMEIIMKLREGVDKELELAKQPYKDNSTLELDDAQGLNWMMAYECHMLNCNYKRIEDRKKAYALVTKERMLEVINNVLIYDNMVINVGSKKNKIKASDIKKVTDVLNDQNHPRL